MFGGLVQEGAVEEWKRESGKAWVIHQAELMPALLAVRLWRKRLTSRRLLIFVDNDAARCALVKGTTPVLPSARMVGAFWSECAAACTYPWVDRVPSISNLADGPSRGEFELLARMGVAMRQLAVLAPFVLRGKKEVGKKRPRS